MEDPDDRQKIIADAIRNLLAKYANNIDETDRLISTAQMMDVISSVIWLNACRSDSAASVYACESLAIALGEHLLETLNQLGSKR